MVVEALEGGLPRAMVATASAPYFPVMVELSIWDASIGILRALANVLSDSFQYVANDYKKNFL